MITLSKKKLTKPLYELTIAKYRNKETGEIIERVENNREIGVGYDFGRMGDFYIENNNTHKNGETNKNKDMK